jgi:hypothetical protein
MESEIMQMMYCDEEPVTYDRVPGIKDKGSNTGL